MICKKLSSKINYQESQKDSKNGVLCHFFDYFHKTCQDNSAFSLRARYSKRELSVLNNILLDNVLFGLSKPACFVNRRTLKKEVISKSKMENLENYQHKPQEYMPQQDQVQSHHVPHHVPQGHVPNVPQVHHPQVHEHVQHQVQQSQHQVQCPKSKQFKQKIEKLRPKWRF